ncbi:type II toxin-antitoxin system Phd/YefM family antitoxin [Chloroflexota bacterium]
MKETQVRIGRASREISELLDRVAHGGERIVLTSRGRPKVAIVSMDDYWFLVQGDLEDPRERWDSWLVQNRKLAEGILARLQGLPLDLDGLWQAVRGDLEERDDHTVGH